MGDWTAGGEFLRGERVVKKGGKIKAGGLVYQDDALIPFVGRRVMVDVKYDLSLVYVTVEASRDGRIQWLTAHRIKG